MPIYEFRCLDCGHIFEILKISREDPQYPSCPQCGLEELERVLSKTAYTSGSEKGQLTSSTHVTEHSCPSGSCQTITLPGHTK